MSASLGCADSKTARMLAFIASKKRPVHGVHVARAVGIRVGNVKSHLARALARGQVRQPGPGLWAATPTTSVPPPPRGQKPNPSSAQQRVLAYVNSTAAVVSTADVGRALRITTSVVATRLARHAEKGRIRKVGRGRYQRLAGAESTGGAS